MQLVFLNCTLDILYIHNGLGNSHLPSCFFSDQSKCDRVQLSIIQCIQLKQQGKCPINRTTQSQTEISIKEKYFLSCNSDMILMGVCMCVSCSAFFGLVFTTFNFLYFTLTHELTWGEARHLKGMPTQTFSTSLV